MLRLLLFVLSLSTEWIFVCKNVKYSNYAYIVKRQTIIIDCGTILSRLHSYSTFFTYSSVCLCWVHSHRIFRSYLKRYRRCSGTLISFSLSLYFTLLVRPKIICCHIQCLVLPCLRIWFYYIMENVNEIFAKRFIALCPLCIIFYSLSICTHTRSLNTLKLRFIYHGRSYLHNFKWSSHKILIHTAFFVSFRIVCSVSFVCWTKLHVVF